MEFELRQSSKKLRDERDKRKNEALKRARENRNKDRMARQQQEAIEQKQREERVKKLEEQQKQEERDLQSGGIRFDQKLTAIPLVSAESLETDRIKLPPSVLDQVVIKQNAFEVNASPLVFELTLHSSLRNNDNSDVIGSTYAGVSEFTAEEGTVVLPMKTAMSLTKELGLEALGMSRSSPSASSSPEISQLEATPFLSAKSTQHLHESDAAKVGVRYVVLERFSKAKIQLQPKGDGFHVQGQESVDMDIRSVLERTLKRHMVISEGDLVPLRYEGVTYTLKVTSLEPESALILLDTELEVDLLPSENAEKELRDKKAREEAESVAKERENQLREHYKQRVRERMQESSFSSVSSSNSRSSSSNSSSDHVAIRVRTPSGKVRSTSLNSKKTSLKMLMDWTLAQLEDEEVPLQALEAQYRGDAPYEFYLVESYPGFKQTYGQGQGQGQGKEKSTAHALTAMEGKTLEDIGLKAGRRINLFISWHMTDQNLGHESSPETTSLWDQQKQQKREDLGGCEKKSAIAANEPESDKWKQAAELAERELDRELSVVPKDALHHETDKVSQGEPQSPLSHVVADNAAANTKNENANENENEKQAQEQEKEEEYQLSSTTNPDNAKKTQGIGTTSSEKVALFQRIAQSETMPSKLAARAAQLYSSQLLQLENMGLIAGSSYARAVQLLDRYQGRLTRVTNAIAELSESPSREDLASDEGQTAAAEIQSEAKPDQNGDSYRDQLAWLHEMGYSDDSKNIRVLRNFNGDLERTVNHLLQGN